MAPFDVGPFSQLSPGLFQVKSLFLVQAVVNFLRPLVSQAAKVLAFIGRHPTPVLILPSLWYLLRYLPFWKDIDATVQLIHRRMTTIFCISPRFTRSLAGSHF